MKPESDASVVFERVAKFCAYRERSEQEIRQKLAELEWPAERHEKVLEFLRSHNFHDQARFAYCYARDKFHFNGWGRLKIRQGLWQRGVEEPLQEQALQEIPEEAYREKLCGWLEQRWAKAKGASVFQRKGQVAQFLVRKGFEPELVWEMLESKA